MEIDRNRLIELCDEIKAKLTEKGKNRFMIRIASTNEFFPDVDDDVREELYNYCDYYGLDSESRLVDYACGGYDRLLLLDGVEIENDTLYFYLSEVHMSEDGDEDIETYRVDLDGLLNDGCWYRDGGALNEFDPNYVLEFYLNHLSSDKCEFIV